MNGEMPTVWTLVCSGRVLGAKTGKAVDNLLRLHKKKCDICRGIQYLCVDEGVVQVKHLHKKGDFLRIEKTTDHHTKRLGELINAMEEI